MADHYRALTRTYRPLTFDDIVSQEHVSSTLKNAIKQNRLAHAYMFCGPRGVGKTTMARVLARTVNNIEDEVDGESLNQTLNVIEIDAASNNGVDDIRDLRERLRIPPQNGRYKIYIIDEVHMLSKAAFNALLKSLEEPPDHVIFIFATTEPHKVLPTILSRVQRFDFKRIQIEEIVSRLAKVAKDEGISVDDESLHVIAKKADGALRDALGLMDQAIAFCGTEIRYEEVLRALNVVSSDRMFEFMDAVEQHDANTGLKLINDLLQEGYDIQEFLIGLTEHLRNLYVALNSESMHLVEASPETKKRYKKASAIFSSDDLMRMLHIVSEAQYKIKEAHQPRIQFEITLLKLIHMERTQKLDALLAELQDLKKKISNTEVTNGQEEQPPASGKNVDEKPAVSQNGQTSPISERKVQDDSAKNGNHTEESPQKAAVNEQNTSERKPPSSVSREAGRPAGEKKPDDFDEFFGTPSLQKGNSNGNSSARPEQASPAVSVETATAEAPKNIELHHVQACWEEYVESLKNRLPQMLYFQMQRIEPIALKNRQLTLRCNDRFAQKIIEENKKELGKILESHLGAFLRFKCTVQKTKESSEDSMSPYERFKNLQRRDPTIKKLVELFGAELDYSLNNES